MFQRDTSVSCSIAAAPPLNWSPNGVHWVPPSKRSPYFVGGYWQLLPRCPSDYTNLLAQKPGVFDRSAEQSKFVLLEIGGECVLMKNDDLDCVIAHAGEIGQPKLEVRFEIPFRCSRCTWVMTV